MKTSRTLFLVRHAKSSWDMNVADWQRPLTEEGIARAEAVAGVMKAEKIKPALIISSHAFRAVNTALIFARILNIPFGQIVVTGALYGKSAGELISFIRDMDDGCGSVMLFGHNPSFTELYNMLTGRMLRNLSTSAAAGIEFSTASWKYLAPPGRTVFLETGKD